MLKLYSLISILVFCTSPISATTPVVIPSQHGVEMNIAHLDAITRTVDEVSSVVVSRDHHSYQTTIAGCVPVVGDYYTVVIPDAAFLIEKQSLDAIYVTSSDYVASITKLRAEKKICVVIGGKKLDTV